jgi:hypothetical protein
MEIVSFIFGALGILFGAFFALRLYRWEQQLAGARIAVAYKQKVRLQAPLIEWLGWANMLAKDEQSSGRVVYRQASTTVAIIKPNRQHGKTKTQVVKTAPHNPRSVASVTRNK